MEKEKEIISYYKEKLPELIEKYKNAVDQCLDIIGQKIDDDLSDDKLHNVLKAKKMAAEDAKFYAKEVDALEREQSGETEDEKVVVKEETTRRSWTERNPS